MEFFLFLCICMDFYGFVKICELLYESLDSMARVWFKKF